MNQAIAAVILFAATVLPSLAFSADNIPTRMTRLTIVWTADNVPHHPFAERPRIYTRATNQYCRFDYEAHPTLGIHQVGIIHEPDLWEIDLISKTALHFVDPGPTFNCHLPIFSIDKNEYDKEIGRLELGRELEFFRVRPARVINAPRGSSAAGRISELRYGDQLLRLTERRDGKGPETIELLYGGKLQRVRYLKWNDQLPFDPHLFAKPEGVIIRNELPRIKWGD